MHRRADVLFCVVVLLGEGVLIIDEISGPSR